MSGHGRVTTKREEDEEEKKEGPASDIALIDKQEQSLQQHPPSHDPALNMFPTSSESASSFVPLKNARRARFPPGCHVLVHPPQPQLHHLPPLVCGIVTDVGVLQTHSDEAKAEPKHYCKVSIQDRSFFVTEDCLEFAPGTPVTIRLRTKLSPPAVVLLGPVLAAGGLEPDGYSVRELGVSANPNQNSVSQGRVHNKIAPDKLLYRFLWDNIIKEERNDNEEEQNIEGTAEIQPAVKQEPHESARTQEEQHQASTVAIKREPQGSTSPEQRRTSAVVAKEEPNSDQQHDPTGGQHRQQRAFSSVDESMSNDRGRKRQKKNPPEDNILEDKTTLPAAASPPQQHHSPPQHLDPAERAAAILHIRRRHLQELPPGRHKYILNESPNPFPSIDVSPLHDVADARRKVRDFLRKHGTQDAANRFGGIGHKLHKRCLSWHIRGYCGGKVCHYRLDHHGTLSAEEAKGIEDALSDAAIRPEGPIYTKVVTDADYNQQIQADLALKEQKRRQTEEAAAAAAIAAAEEARKPHIIYKLPALFGALFFQRVLGEPGKKDAMVSRIQEEFQCSWEILEGIQQEPPNSGRKFFKLRVSGVSMGKLLECQSAIEDFLCLRCPPDLRGLLVMELERLNKTIGTSGTEDLFLRCRIRQGSSHENIGTPIWWFTKVNIGKTTDEGNNTLSLEDASQDVKGLKLSYEKDCEITLYQGHMRNHDTVPFHLLICGRWNPKVEECRRQFFKLANDRNKADSDDGDGW